MKTPQTLDEALEVIGKMHTSLRSICSAYKVMVSNGSTMGTFERHVRPEINRAQQLLYHLDPNPENVKRAQKRG